MSNEPQFDIDRAIAETVVHGYRTRGDTTVPRRWIPEEAEQEPRLSTHEVHRLILLPALFARDSRERRTRHSSFLPEERGAQIRARTRHSHPSAAPLHRSLSQPSIPSDRTSRSYHTAPLSPQSSLSALQAESPRVQPTRVSSSTTQQVSAGALRRKLQLLKSNTKRRIIRAFGKFIRKPQQPKSKSPSLITV